MRKIALMYEVRIPSSLYRISRLNIKPKIISEESRGE